MAEYIKRDEAYNVLTDYYHHSTKIQHEALRDAISRIPSADVKPVVHGKWMPFLPEYGDMYTCSECQKVTRYFQKKQWIPANLYNYCPNCGARMDGE